MISGTTCCTGRGTECGTGCGTGRAGQSKGKIPNNGYAASSRSFPPNTHAYALIRAHTRPYPRNASYLRILRGLRHVLHMLGCNQGFRISRIRIHPARAAGRVQSRNQSIAQSIHPRKQSATHRTVSVSPHTWAPHTGNADLGSNSMAEVTRYYYNLCA